MVTQVHLVFRVLRDTQDFLGSQASQAFQAFQGDLGFQVSRDLVGYLAIRDQASRATQAQVFQARQAWLVRCDMVRTGWVFSGRLGEVGIGVVCKVLSGRQGGVRSYWVRRDLTR